MPFLPLDLILPTPQSLIVLLPSIIHFLFNFLATLCGMWDLSFPTRDWTRAPCCGSVASSPLDRQGSPPPIFLDMLLPPSQCSHMPPDPIDLSLLLQPCALRSPGVSTDLPSSRVVESSTEGTPACSRTSTFLCIVTLGSLASFHDTM